MKYAPSNSRKMFGGSSMLSPSLAGIGTNFFDKAEEKQNNFDDYREEKKGGN